MRKFVECLFDIVLRGFFVDTGSPHAVLPVHWLNAGRTRLGDVKVQELGQVMRYDRMFGTEGANINFITRDSANRVWVRTYERGVEAETLACGTGSVASALCASRIWSLPSPITIIAHSGKKLRVRFAGVPEEARDVVLSGPAEATFAGEFIV